jgi:Fic family protein
MGRLWHTLLLGKWKEMFYWLPIEDLIRTRQKTYYDALGKADMDADSSEFVYMMLRIIYDTLKDYESDTDQENDQDTDQVKTDNPSVNKLLEVMGQDTLSAAQIMENLGLNHRATFRQNYLNPALELGVIERTIPDKPNSRNQRYRRKETHYEFNGHRR